MEEKEATSFWKTAPGVMTALGTLIAACAGLLTALYTTGVIGGGSEEQPRDRSLDNPPAQPAPRAAASPGDTDPAVRRDDAASSARAILKAYKARDLITLAEYAHPGNRDLMAELVRQGKSHPRYDSLFAGWRWRAVASWDGRIHEVHRRDRGRVPEAQVRFGMINKDEVAVVTLQLLDGKWMFEDIHSPSLSSWNGD